MEQAQLKSIVESLLFISGEPIKLKMLAQVADVSFADIKIALEALHGDYKNSDRGLSIIEKEDEAQMVTASANSEFVRKMMETDMKSDLSRATLETLAIVAYRGPLTRMKIEEVRGVNCSFALRYLLIRGLVERIENPDDSRSYLYKISFDFLKNLGLERISDLPKYEELKNKILPGIDDVNAAGEGNQIIGQSPENPNLEQKILPNSNN